MQELRFLFAGVQLTSSVQVLKAIDAFHSNSAVGICTNTDLFSSDSSYVAMWNLL